jgi:hypothetical protein
LLAEVAHWLRESLIAFGHHPVTAEVGFGRRKEQRNNAGRSNFHAVKAAIERAGRRLVSVAFDGHDIRPCLRSGSEMRDGCRVNISIQQVCAHFGQSR